MTIDYFTIMRRPTVRRSVLKNEMLSGFDSLLDAFFDETFSKEFKNQFSQKGKYPKVNIIGLEEKVVLEAAIPGMTRDDITIEVDEDNDTLTISGKSQQKSEYKDLYLTQEIKRSQFSRSFILSKESLDLTKISAQCDNGILTIEIPRINPEERAPKIRKVNIA